MICLSLQLQGLCGRFDGLPEGDLRRLDDDMEATVKEVADSFSDRDCGVVSVPEVPMIDVSLALKPTLIFQVQACSDMEGVAKVPAFQNKQDVNLVSILIYKEQF